MQKGSDRNPEPSRDLLDQFPQNRRSWVANTFLSVVRDGAASVEAVLVGVATRVETAIADAVRYSNYDWARERMRRDRSLLDVLGTPEAAAYAAWALEYNQLPRLAREAIREAEGFVHRAAWMDAQPPTDRQLAYLRRLGHDGDPPASKLAASQLIDALLRQNTG